MNEDWRGDQGPPQEFPTTTSDARESGSTTRDSTGTDRADGNSRRISTGDHLKPGLAGCYEADVRLEWTRAHYDKHLPAVFSTPAMIGMMEGACANAIEAALPPGTLSVGTRIEVDHLKALPVGARVVASARLAEVNGRFLTFDVEAYSGAMLIGRGRIFHAVVDLARFQRIAAGA